MVSTAYTQEISNWLARNGNASEMTKTEQVWASDHVWGSSHSIWDSSNNVWGKTDEQTAENTAVATTSNA